MVAGLVLVATPQESRLNQVLGVATLSLRQALLDFLDEFDLGEGFHHVLNPLRRHFLNGSGLQFIAEGFFLNPSHLSEDPGHFDFIL